MKNLIIKLIDPTIAMEVCRSITVTLPEWFGIPEERGVEAMIPIAFVSYCNIHSPCFLIS